MPYGDAKRKVFFYRALTPDGDSLDPAAICSGISGLSDPYHEDGDQVTRAEVYRATAPQFIRFFKVRRDDLPPKDDGQGHDEDLDLTPEEGLAEAIHLVLFPNGVIGAEFFFYGPRVSRFALYLRTMLPMDCQVRQMIRHDVVEQALGFHDIRLLRIKIDPSDESKAVLAAAGAAGFLDTATRFDAGIYADLVLRADKDAEGFREQVKRFVRDILGSDDDHSDESDSAVFDKLEIEGKRRPDLPVESLDLLSEKLYRQVEIPYAAERTRALNADRAFDAIVGAYREVEDDLPQDALG